MTFLFFLAAASIIALSPGPGILYVTARTLTGGRGEGLASSLEHRAFNRGHSLRL
jgi:threonine/homoserine/homoserine lactone efflux protein